MTYNVDLEKLIRTFTLSYKRPPDLNMLCKLAIRAQGCPLWTI